MRSNFAFALCSALALVACSSSSTPDAATATIDAHAGIDAPAGTPDATAAVTVNGCTAATAVDKTGMTAVTIGFGGTAGSTFYTYSPACVKVSTGTVVTFSGPFSSHAFEGGTVTGTTITAATTGPFATTVTTGTTKDFTMTDAGTFGFLCEYHAASNQMYGAVFVQ